MQSGDNSCIDSCMISELRYKIADNSLLNNYTFEDEILTIYLRLLNQDVSNVISHFESMIKVAARHGHNFCRLPENYSTIMRKRFHRILKSRDVNGAGINMLKLANWNPSQVSFSDLLQVMQVSIHAHLFRDAKNQEKHFMTIVDCRGSRVRHLFNTTWKVVMSSLEIANLYQPYVRAKVHILYTSKWFAYGFMMVKPLLSQDVLENVHFYGDDLSELVKYFPLSALPPDIGGTFVDDYSDDEYEQIILDEIPRLTKFFSQFKKTK